MKHWPFLLTAAALLAIVPVMSGHAQEDVLKALMLKKLQNSERILEGLAMGDFDKIGNHAEELIRVVKQVEFKVLKTPQYEIYSNDFRRNAETLVTMAKAKNIDGAALAYVELTLTCVKCHKHVREVRMARLD